MEQGVAMIDDPAKVTADVISFATVIGTLLQWLPAAAALASLVWTCIRIYETQTIQKLLRKDKQNDSQN
jgi:hypothetical protein